MTPAEQMNGLRDQLIPVMGEWGIEAFALVAYVRLEDGKLTRICIGHDGGNPAYQDGLRPAVLFAHHWAGLDPRSEIAEQEEDE